jgi:hypothetical protein
MDGGLEKLSRLYRELEGVGSLFDESAKIGRKKLSGFVGHRVCSGEEVTKVVRNRQKSSTFREKESCVGFCLV